MPTPGSFLVEDNYTMKVDSHGPLTVTSAPTSPSLEPSLVATDEEDVALDFVGTHS